MTKMCQCKTILMTEWCKTGNQIGNEGTSKLIPIIKSNKHILTLDLTRKETLCSSIILQSNCHLFIRNGYWSKRCGNNKWCSCEKQSSYFTLVGRSVHCRFWLPLSSRRFSDRQQNWFQWCSSTQKCTNGKFSFDWTASWQFVDIWFLCMKLTIIHGHAAPPQTQT